MQFGFRHARAGAAGIDQLAVVAVIAEQQRSERRARPFRIGPADDHEFLPVEKLGLDPDAAVAGHVGLVDLLRDHALDAELRPFLENVRAVADDMAAEAEACGASRSRASSRAFAFEQRQPHQILAVEMQQIEREIHQLGRRDPHAPARPRMTSCRPAAPRRVRRRDRPAGI